MSSAAITVEQISKRFQMGSGATYGLLSEFLQDATIRLVARQTRRLFGGYDRYREGETLRQLWALRDVSFRVDQGEVVGVIGRNGAGKSTLLKILSRILHPTRGRIEISGRIGSLLEVGTGFHPELTGRENIYLNGAILGMTRREIQHKFDDIVDFAEMAPFLDTPLKRYSSGMAVRLAFAVAAHLEPEVLLIDEVLAVGDMGFQKKCIGKMEEVSRHGRTVLIVSHNLPVIANLCSRALLLEAGTVAAEGAAVDVVRTYMERSPSAGGEIVWPDPSAAPGNDVVRLRSVRILQDGGDSSTGDVDISRDVIVELTYHNLRPGEQLFGALWLKDQFGTTVLSSASADGCNQRQDEWFGRPHPPGIFRTRCRIPGNFLNEGTYHITAMVNHLPWETLVMEDDAVQFHVHDTGSMRQTYYGKWAGVVRPQLPWSTEFVEASESEN